MNNGFKISRRELGAVAAVGLVGFSKSVSAQTTTLPQLDETLRFLSSGATMRLLISQFSLAYSIAENAVLALDTEGLEDPETLQSLYSAGDASSAQLFSVLFQIASPDSEAFREEISNRLRNADITLADDSAHARLVDNFQEVAGELGLDPQSELGQAATESLTHVGRIGQAVPDSFFLCRIFPFSTRQFCDTN